ncbi:hypothetical protein [Draconibacterium sediminis]|uniref:Beta-carotene 15,15'-monooxygenase n=1 Tax=Draconibacterium sediminis TaxID=1544798 RepID=A0A0D8J5N4_9BACT|nr:hypothetical protein [Draconibacterium sediminis]KJF41826.1 hypothetical protein LH29_23090 [Draconibacterium sediminis]
MELNELKKTWSKITPSKELDENQLNTMLSKRTKNLIERIDRNIRIGFIILLGLIVLFTLDDFILSPETIEKHYSDLPIPNWVLFMGVFGNVLIVTTFLYFVIKYYRVKKQCDVACDLKGTLKKIIETLSLYQRLFYLALATLLLSMASAFISGMFIGTEYNAEAQGMHLSDIETSKIILTVGITVLLVAVFGGAIFLFLRWGFRKLYGNYIKKLKATLRELEELD